jgi:hypothetical protein
MGFGLSAMLYFTLSSNRSSNCQINGVSCAEMEALNLFLICALPTAVFLFIVLLGIRVKRHSPRAAAWLVSLPPAVLLVYAAFQASTMPVGG